MLNTLRLAFKNLTRYKRRSLLTGLLIVLGVGAVIVFSGLSDSFKRLMIGQITDSMLSHLQVHKKGYVASIDNLPLNLNLPPQAYQRVKAMLEAEPGVAALAPRLKLGGMLSNFETTTAVRINGIEPQAEDQVVPDLRGRVSGRQPGQALVGRGEILLPEVLARGLDLQPGAEVVVVATNREGSVNGLPLRVGGVVASVMGPGGRDGYMHIDDAAELLRMPKPEISEVVVRVKDFNKLEEVAGRLKTELEQGKNPKGLPMFELHTWADLAPFAHIARLIDLMTIFIKAILVAVVLISILNVMMMSVFERVREIGTLMAIGTTPGKVARLFLAEGFILGLASSLAGAALGVGVIAALHATKVSFLFGMGQRIVLAPTVGAGTVVGVCLIVVAVAALASLQPAMKAARLEPVEALRHV
ncbi:MAG: ABC transporter permease [Desulfarculus sp.]|nr:ABC transporter permease [Desulfarculus sp.]